ncbi:MAG: discoidin domain-containing protein [Lewinella sp.]|nr:discoidin domain-containing protein [Lewinella sp.]
MKNLLLTLAILIVGMLFCGCNATEQEPWPIVQLPPDADTTNAYWKGIDLAPKPPVKPLPVKEEAQHFILPEGYAMEGVLADPKIEQPGAITFDGNGRMYVLELRSYMLNLESEGTLEPISVISRWEDKDNDGTYETGGPFLENLVFPRFVLPIGPNTILTMESNQDDVYAYTDTDGDGKADKKEFFTDNFGRAGNVEHQQGFLYWGMDNWLYSTVNPFRIRWTPNGVIREPTASNHAQWGVTHDDDGKLWFQGGSNGLPSYFQFPVHYGDYVVENNFAEGFEVPWGADLNGIGDMQAGMRAVRMPEGTLNQVTGAAGNDVFRGDRLPEELRGEYFYGEPVARIVRQIHPEVREGLTLLHNVYQEQQSEFLRSTDPLFRPVDMTTAPDGTLYITDMYHGIIQEGEWAGEGSYLRVKILQYQLDKVVGLGRIWRLTHRAFERDKTQPRMYEETAEELLAHLSHPNGWWRDMAQQVLVQRRDQSVAPELETIVRSSDNLLARFHALWVLEGIGSLQASLIRDLLHDPNPRMRKMAMWAGESLYKAGETSLANDYLAMMKDADEEVRMRALMTGRLLKIPGTEAIAKHELAASRHAGLQLVAKQVIDPPQISSFFGRSNPNFDEQEQALVDAGAKIFSSLCATCHGPLGAGTPVGEGELMAPSFIGSDRVQAHPDYFINILLHGLTGDIEGQSYTGIIMAPMGDQSDEWVASVASFVRANFENEASVIQPEEVTRVRQETASRKKPYAYEELMELVPKSLHPTDSWKLTASHSESIRKGSSASPAAALTFEGWTTGITQEAGMWFQIELPEVHRISELTFVSPSINRGRGENAPPPLQTYPHAYTLSVSANGRDWTDLIPDGRSTDNPSRIRFAPTEAKVLRIALTESQQDIEGEWFGRKRIFKTPWVMRELAVWGW